MSPLQTYFPTLLWKNALPLGAAFRAQILRECQAFRKLDRAGVRWSRENYPGGYTSYSSVTDLPDRSPTFARLRESIDREVSRYARELDLDLDAGRGRGRGRLRMTECWINIMGAGAHHSFHLHPLSAVSGTYYVQMPRGAGAFKIEDPRIACFMGSPPRKLRARLANRRYCDISTRAGELLLFESWLKHEVPTHLGAEERVSISFNYDWV